MRPKAQSRSAGRGPGLYGLLLFPAALRTKEYGESLQAGGVETAGIMQLMTYYAGVAALHETAKLQSGLVSPSDPLRPLAGHTLQFRPKPTFPPRHRQAYPAAPGPLALSSTTASSLSPTGSQPSTSRPMYWPQVRMLPGLLSRRFPRACQPLQWLQTRRPAIRNV